MKVPFFLKLDYFLPLALFPAVCFLLYYLLYLRQIQRWKASNIPSTRPFFLLGHKHFFKLLSNAMPVPLDMIYRENEDKDLVGFFLSFFPIILVREPNIIKELWSKSVDKTFANGFSPVKDDVAYHNVIPLANDRDFWKTGRSTIVTSLQISKLKTSDFSKFRKQIERLWHHVEQLEQVGQPLDVHDAAIKFVVDSISAWNFGEDTNSWEKKTVLGELSASLLQSTLQRLGSFLVLFLLPFLQFFDYFRFIRRGHIDSATKYMKQKIEHRDQNQISRDDFIGHLMSLRKTEVPQNTSDYSKKDKGISLQEMAGYALTWSLAGFDSTSQLCLFTLHLLSLHPEYQDKIREELNETMKKLNVSEITFQVLQELQLTNCCLLEAARLYPGLPALLKRCSEDFQIPGTKYKLRKGDLVFAPLISIQRDPRFFKDPNSFNPERFSTSNKSPDRLDMLLAFGIGVRKCPGYRVGLSLALMFVTSLLYKYEVRPRSHMKQMVATDLDPVNFSNRSREKLLVDLAPRKFSKISMQ